MGNRFDLIWRNGSRPCLLRDHKVNLAMSLRLCGMRTLRWRGAWLASSSRLTSWRLTRGISRLLLMWVSCQNKKRTHHWLVFACRNNVFSVRYICVVHNFSNFTCFTDMRDSHVCARILHAACLRMGACVCVCVYSWFYTCDAYSHAHTSTKICKKSTLCKISYICMHK